MAPPPRPADCPPGLEYLTSLGIINGGSSVLDVHVSTIYYNNSFNIVMYVILYLKLFHIEFIEVQELIPITHG